MRQFVVGVILHSQGLTSHGWPGSRFIKTEVVTQSKDLTSGVPIL